MSYYSNAEDVVDGAIENIKQQLIDELEESGEKFTSIEEMKEWLSDNCSMETRFDIAFDNDVEYDSDSIIEDYGAMDAISDYCDADDIAKRIIDDEIGNTSSANEENIIENFFDDSDYKDRIDALLKPENPNAENDAKTVCALNDLVTALNTLIETNKTDGKIIIQTLGIGIINQISHDTEGRINSHISECLLNLSTAKTRNEIPQKPATESEGNTTDSNEN